jgi:uncharacterized protein YjiS (DUF1127 family)
MTAQNSKQALAFNLPEMLSYHSTWDDADYEPVLPPRRPSITHRLGEFFHRMAVAPQRAATRAELAAMTDRELADIGLSRYDIGRVFDPVFAREYADRGR